MHKKCFKCNIDKPIEDFYRHPKMRDGHLNKCKECTKKDIQADYRANPKAHQDYEKVREQTPARKAKQLDYQRTRRAKKRLENNARGRVAYAIRSGSLVPQPCADCGCSEKIEAHHENYFEALSVVWLCFNCHRIRHGQIILPTLNRESQ